MSNEINPKKNSAAALTKGALILTTFLSGARIAFSEAPKADCAKPSVLRITNRNNDLWYQVNTNKPHKLYSLGEVSQSMRGCPADKMLFVIADPDIPIGKLMVPGKEQLASVRYFILYKTGDVQEVSFALSYPTIPFSRDVIGYQPYDDPPPELTQKAKGPK